MDGLLRSGRAIFAISIGAFGIEHFTYARCAGELANIPPYTANGPVSGWLIGAGLIVAALSVASGKKAELAALLLGAALFIDFVVVHTPKMLANLQSGNLRTRGFETLAMSATALVLAAAFAAAQAGSSRRLPDVGTAAQAGRYCFAAALAIFGIQHFMYRSLITSLIPAWFPGRLFLAYFTGAAFLAAALSFALGKVTRLAGILLAAMFLLWVATLHAPRVAHTLHNGNEWASMFVALCMGGAGLIFAAAFPGKR